MAISTIDYENVEPTLLALIMQLNSIQGQVATLGVAGSAEFVRQIDIFRNNVALEIEKQGARA